MVCAEQTYSWWTSRAKEDSRKSACVRPIVFMRWRKHINKYFQISFVEQIISNDLFFLFFAQKLASKALSGRIDGNGWKDDFGFLFLFCGLRFFIYAQYLIEKHILRRSKKEEKVPCRARRLRLSQSLLKVC